MFILLYSIDRLIKHNFPPNPTSPSPSIRPHFLYALLYTFVLFEIMYRKKKKCDDTHTKEEENSDINIKMNATEVNVGTKQIRSLFSKTLVLGVRA